MDETTCGLLQAQTIFNNHVKCIWLRQQEYESKLERILVRQLGSVDNMIKYLETIDDWMRDLQRRRGISVPVFVPCPNLPLNPALESSLRQVSTLRTAAEGMAPMKVPMRSGPYGPPRVDRSLLRHIPPFSACVMVGEKTPEKGSGMGTLKRDTRADMVQIDISSTSAAATFNARAAFAARVKEEVLRSAARRDGSSGSRAPRGRGPVALAVLCPGGVRGGWRSSILATLKQNKVCTQTHQGMYTGWLSQADE